MKVKRITLKQWAVGFAMTSLLTGCTTNDTEPAQGSFDTPNVPVRAASDIQGELTYQDVLQKGEHIHFVKPSPDGSRLWLGTHVGLYGTASQKLWAETPEDLALDDIRGAFFDPEETEHVYVTGQGVAKRSRDGGETWEPMITGLPDQPDILGLTGVRQKDQVNLYVYVSGMGIYQSRDGGDRWELMEELQQLNQEVYAIDYNAYEERLYVLTQNGLLSAQEGKWESEVIEGVERVFSLAIDNQHNKMYLSTDQGIMVKEEDSDWEMLSQDVPERLSAISPGHSEDTLIGIGDSAIIYFYENGEWKKWQ
ncbi:WD40/YVTN/BNR-like repeat-containing protein [Brevibacillus dissolubilis]|uniref:WD40/YVTN/BNR-like repeat-containing protein n=1 Tax=Brevibacillus dissolubilis TaxID=1844116 RepID=UPI0011169045|nr:hypothetical protein [Brevibacillus dissolubilis]